MNKQEYIQVFTQAATDGTLLAPKHDPSSLGTIYTRYRTVLSYELADSLSGFLSSGEYRLREYHNMSFPNSPKYIEIEPNPGSTFSVPASGVNMNSPFATSAVDRLILVSGTSQGWHIFGESSIVIQQMLTAGDLSFLQEL